jgi:hypothetical protein
MIGEQRYQLMNEDKRPIVECGFYKHSAPFPKQHTSVGTLYPVGRHPPHWSACRFSRFRLGRTMLPILQ